jgi:hypothetical protein
MNCPANLETPASDALIVVGLSLPVLTLSAWLLAQRHALRHLHIVGSAQGLSALKALTQHAGLPPCEALFWHGDDVDGQDGELSQRQFRQILARILCAGERAAPMQLVLGGGVNWMIALAAQAAAFTLREARGDGLWALKTAPRLENHPHFLKPGDTPLVLDAESGILPPPANGSALHKIALIDGACFQSAPAGDTLSFDDECLRFMGATLPLPPLQLAFYRWLLQHTKLNCRRPQLASCEACYACALPAKHLSSLNEDFHAFYLGTSAKPGYVKPLEALDFPQRVAETVSKINARLRKHGNVALHRQLKVNHTEGGYLPGVDKNYLKGE